MAFIEKNRTLIAWLAIACLWQALPVAAVAQTAIAHDAGATPQAEHLAGGANKPQNSAVSIDRESPIPLKIKLPFPAGASYSVVQGNAGSFTHTGFNRYAWDFALPENSPVAAAAAGRVVRVKQDGKSGGASNEFFSEGNTIILDHGNGYYSQYLHLAQGSALVREGDLVSGGQVIARSGNTGFSTMPHLHFQVQDATGQSLPVKFEDVPGNGLPQTDAVVTSHNNGSGTSQYAGESRLPPDVFRRNNIVLITRTLPGHLFRSFQSYPVKGRLLGNNDASKVAIYFMASNGGSPLQITYAKVDRYGYFEATIEPGKIEASEQASQVDDKESTGSAVSELRRRRQSKMYSLAIAPVKLDGTFWSDISVPVCVR